MEVYRLVSPLRTALLALFQGATVIRSTKSARHFHSHRKQSKPIQFVEMKKKCEVGIKFQIQITASGKQENENILCIHQHVIIIIRMYLNKLANTPHHTT